MLSKQHLIRDLIKFDVITVQYMPTASMMADILTKPVDTRIFRNHQFTVQVTQFQGWGLVVLSNMQTKSQIDVEQNVLVLIPNVDQGQNKEYNIWWTIIGSFSTCELICHIDTTVSIKTNATRNGFLTDSLKPVVLITTLYHILL